MKSVVWAALVATLAAGLGACSGKVVEAGPDSQTGGQAGYAAASGSGGGQTGGTSGSGGTSGTAGTGGGTGGNAGTGGGTGGAAGLGGTGGAAGLGGSGGTAGLGGSGGGAVVRTIIQRDIFENHDVADNLMLDGGFEFSGELGALWAANSYDPMPFGNGAVCRTGLRCGIAKKDEGIFGFFVSNVSGGLSVQLRTNPSGTDCESLYVAAIDIYAQNMQPAFVNITKATQGTDGWCNLSGTLASMPYTSPALYIEPYAGELVVDDVVVRPATGATVLSAKVQPQVSGALLSKLEQARVRARDILENKAPKRRSLRKGAPWSARFDPWIR